MPTFFPFDDTAPGLNFTSCDRPSFNRIIEDSDCEFSRISTFRRQQRRLQQRPNEQISGNVHTANDLRSGNL
ncbi:16596_t:CDS:2 [Acaulospora colombiana]|uniref:16596_t:CDS:1 n=1 Tax=Acaulospora colombiana TaxID=27376 RepID=A0ACA9JW24_9GLOM|nr:16596_t:CDS:2 [Acaulospora colombiana]